QTITGGAATVSPSRTTSDPMPGLNINAQPGAAQLAAGDAAADRIRTQPKDVGAHLDLAQAYTDAGAPQLSAIEYLAVIQLEPSNAREKTEPALQGFATRQA